MAATRKNEGTPAMRKDAPLGPGFHTPLPPEDVEVIEQIGNEAFDDRCGYGGHGRPRAFRPSIPNQVPLNANTWSNPVSNTWFRPVLGASGEAAPEHRLIRDRLAGGDIEQAIKVACDRLHVDGVLGWASEIARRPIRRLNPPEYALWEMDLLRAAGELTPMAVALPDLPATATDTARHVAVRFAHCVGLKALRPDGISPTAFTRRFASRWCGITEAQAEAAKGELIAAGVIVKAGTHESRFPGHPTTLYSPGPLR